MIRSILLRRGSPPQAGENAPASLLLGVALQPIVLAVMVYVLAVTLVFERDFAPLLDSNIGIIPNFSVPATIIGLCVIAVVRDRRNPLTALTELLRKQGGVIILSNLLFLLGLSAYTTVKINIPNMVPFYADPWLADIDKVLHATVPWAALFRGPPEIAHYVDILYSRLWPLEMMGIFVAATLLLSGAPLKRYMWMVFFNYVFIGNILATALSSVGPIFYNHFYTDGRFATETAAFFSNPYIGNIQDYANYLFANYQSSSPAFGTGISSMPSVHVAFATLGAWTLMSFNRVLGGFGWIFAILIELGSIYTGWHYAVDGYVSLTLVSLAWIGFSRFYGLPLLPPKKKAITLFESHI